MKLIENKDYRIVGRTAYVRMSLKKEAYTEGSEAFYAVEKLWKQGYHIQYASDHFVLTGEHDSPPNGTPYLV